ncbi:MAG: DUF4350 domain-containing protein [bacterium]
MKDHRVALSKCVGAAGVVVSTGLPSVLLRRPLFPSQLHPVAWSVAAFSFLLLWRDGINVQKKSLYWVVASIICILAIVRSRVLPPAHVTRYDILFIIVALSLVYRGTIRELALFMICVLAPLALAELYGFMPSFTAEIMLIGAGIGIGALLPRVRPRFTSKGGAWAAILGAVLLVLIGVVSCLMVCFPLGNPKNKRVVFDTGHGTTESPLIDYTRSIDTGAEFGHAHLVRFLSMHGFHCEMADSIAGDTLSGASILVLIMPSLPYSPEEIETIRVFVAEGGGLLVIGDHTDISHVLSSLNPVIEQFGIRLRFDTIWLQRNDRINLDYRHHPATFDLAMVNFSVGASLDITPPSRPVIVSPCGTFSDRGDPENAAHAYLGNSVRDSGEEMTDLCLIADCLYGRGRVVVMGDSSYFQNASLYRNRVFAYRLFDWLNRRNGERGMRVMLLIVFLSLIAVLTVLTGYGSGFHGSLLPAASLIILCSLWMGTLRNLTRLRRPEPLFATIFIDMTHQNEYSLYWINREKADTSLDGFTGQIIRSGMFPVIDTEGPITSESLRGHRAVFVICPNAPFSEEEIEAIEEFVENGGGLLLVEGPRKWATSTALWERFGLIKHRYPLSVNRPILSPFGLPIRLQYGNFRASFIPHPITRGITQINMVNPCAIQGGFPVAFIDNVPVVNFMEYGKGRIVAIGDDRFFANYMTEYQEKVIDPEKLRLTWNLIDYCAYETVQREGH